jgi:hypothetical protein
VLAIDASHAVMRDASRRAAAPARRGGLPNALFIVSGLEQLPAEPAGLASLVTVHFPWGSLLRAAAGHDVHGAALVAGLVAPHGVLRLLLSAAERDAAGGMSDIDPGHVADTYRGLGMRLIRCRPATADDIAAAHSTWARRLLTSGRDRATWLIELRAAAS